MKSRAARRILTCLVAGTVSVAFAPGLAGAAPPAPGGTYAIPAGAACAFPISYHEDVNSEITREHHNHTITTGQYKVTVTNTDNQKSLTVNVVGPGVDQTAVGPWLFLLGPDEVYGPGMFLLTGRTTVVRDQVSGLITSLTTTGKVSADLCPRIA